MGLASLGIFRAEKPHEGLLPIGFQDQLTSPQSKPHRVFRELQLHIG